MEEGRKTPLYDRHVASGGKMVSFAGYMLPVQYAGVIAEHNAVRTKAGLFDVSHMAEVFITGPDAFANLQKLFTNDFSGLADGRVRYTVMCNDAGGAVDDLIVYRYDGEKYLAVLNAANREKDVAWIKSHLSGDVALTDTSDETGQIALQGPASARILEKLVARADIPDKYYSFKETDAGDVRCLVSQTGYTGELGFEIYMPAEDAPRLWETLLDAGREEGLVPAGLGARDTLRFEAGMPLYGHEMNEEITPFEVGLDFAVKLNKDDFIGKTALEAGRNPSRRRVGLKVTERGIARENSAVYVGDRVVGKTTSGTHCPYLGGAYAMAMLETAYTEPETAVEIDVRGRRIAAKVVPLPFYKR